MSHRFFRPVSCIATLVMLALAGLQPASGAGLTIELYATAQNHTLFGDNTALSDCIHPPSVCSNAWDGSPVSTTLHNDNGYGHSEAQGTFGHLSAAATGAGDTFQDGGSGGGVAHFSDTLTITSLTLPVGTAVVVRYAVDLDYSGGGTGDGFNGAQARFGQQSCCWIAPIADTTGGVFQDIAYQVGDIVSIDGWLSWSAGVYGNNYPFIPSRSVTADAHYFIEVLTGDAGFSSASGFDYARAAVVDIPAPGTLWLLGAGLLPLGLIRRRAGPRALIMT